MIHKNACITNKLVNFNAGPYFPLIFSAHLRKKMPYKKYAEIIKEKLIVYSKEESLKF